MIILYNAWLLDDLSVIQTDIDRLRLEAKKEGAPRTAKELLDIQKRLLAYKLRLVAARSEQRKREA